MVIKNKRGQEGVSTGTIIGIIIAVVVLIVVIIFFTGGFGGIGEKLQSFFGTGATVETVIQACNLAASSDSKYGYCEDFKKVTFPTGVEYINCEDSRVLSKIEQKINCEGSPKEAYCNSTIQAAALKAAGISITDLAGADAAKKTAYDTQVKSSCTSIKVNGQICNSNQAPTSICKTPSTSP